MDTRGEDEYVRRHELARFESEMEVMNAKLNATLEGMRADMAKFYAAAAERELKREQEAAAREHRYQQEMAKFQAEMAKFQTQMTNFQTQMADVQTEMANFQTEMRITGRTWPSAKPALYGLW